jgi:RNA polymerase sigma-70 factor (ECF subfamily)
METRREMAGTEALAALRTGDRAAVVAELERQLDPLYRFVARELRYQAALGNLQPGDVAPEEIVDEVALRALRRMPRMPQQATMRGWLRLLALRAIEDRVRQTRRQRRHEAVSLEAPLPLGQRADVYYQPDAALTWADVLPAPGPSPEEALLLNETREELEQALNELPPDQRLAFVLRAIEGLGYAEIAAITHQSRSDVRQAYHAAREALRQRFAGRFFPAGAASPAPPGSPTAPDDGRPQTVAD